MLNCKKPSNNLTDLNSKLSACTIRCDEVAECIDGGKTECDAPELNKLLNLVYTALPNFAFGNSSVAIVALDSFTTQATAFPVGPLNYYVKLPHEFHQEVRLMWPAIQIINDLINKLGTGKFIFNGTSGVTGGTFGYVSLDVNLNVISQKAIKDPTKGTLILNRRNSRNGDHMCDPVPVATWDYKFVLTFAPPVVAPGAGILTNILATLSTPDNPNGSLQISIAPPIGSLPGTQLTSDNLTISEVIPGDANQFANLINNLFIAITGTTIPSSILSSTIPPFVAILSYYGATPSDLVLIQTSNTYNGATVGTDGTTIVLTFRVGGVTLAGTITLQVPPAGNLVVNSIGHYISFVDGILGWVATSLQNSNI